MSHGEPRYATPRTIVAALVAIALVAGACGSETPEPAAAPPATEQSTPAPMPEPTAAPAPTPTPEEPTPEAGPTIDATAAAFEADVLPIVNETCAQCHTGDGPGTQHVRFDTAADLVENADDIALAVAGRVMPPWPASDLSPAFHDDWSLSSDQIDAITAWHAAGAELDVPSDTTIEATNQMISLADVDVDIAPVEGFDGDPSYGDEYRCLVYDPQITEPTWLAGFEFVPDQTEVVHHAIGYRLPADMRAEIDAKAAAQADGGGWTCFSNGEYEIFLGWAPGQRASQFPDGYGLFMAPGDFIVVQVHYHFDVDAPEDRSSVRLDVAEGDGAFEEVRLQTLVAPAEIPCTADEAGPLCDRDTAQAAALEKYGPRGALADTILQVCGYAPEDFADMTDGVASADCTWPVQHPGRLLSVLGHEHELGAAFRMTLNPGSPDERILLDIPRWDFDWQYRYQLADDVVLARGDEIRIECTWDRSLRDPDLEPAYVLWADGTDDEMCFATVTTLPV